MKIAAEFVISYHKNSCNAKSNYYTAKRQQYVTYPNAYSFVSSINNPFTSLNNHP